MNLVFVETPHFARQRERYLDDQDFLRLQTALLRAPGAGAVGPGTGGLRKLRWADTRRGTGKRGGLRIWYCHLPDNGEIWFFVAVDTELSQRRRTP